MNFKKLIVALKNYGLKILEKNNLFGSLIELRNQHLVIKQLKEKENKPKINLNNCIYFQNIENISFGKNVSIGPYNVIFVSGYSADKKSEAKLKIGDGTTIGEQNNIRAGGGSIIIGKDCRISQQVSIIASDHGIEKDELISNQEWHSKGDIFIEDDVWIGCSSQILSGVTVGKGSVVAAGSLVLKNVPPYAIVGGVPVKVLKYRT